MTGTQRSPAVLLAGVAVAAALALGCATPRPFQRHGLTYMLTEESRIAYEAAVREADAIQKRDGGDAAGACHSLTGAVERLERTEPRPGGWERPRDTSWWVLQRDRDAACKLAALQERQRVEAEAQRQALRAQEAEARRRREAEAARREAVARAAAEAEAARVRQAQAEEAARERVRQDRLAKCRAVVVEGTFEGRVGELAAAAGPSGTVSGEELVPALLRPCAQENEFEGARCLEARREAERAVKATILMSDLVAPGRYNFKRGTFPVRLIRSGTVMLDSKYDTAETFGWVSADERTIQVSVPDRGEAEQIRAGTEGWDDPDHRGLVVFYLVRGGAVTMRRPPEIRLWRMMRQAAAVKPARNQFEREFLRAMAATPKTQRSVGLRVEAYQVFSAVTGRLLASSMPALEIDEAEARACAEVVDEPATKWTFAYRALLQAHLRAEGGGWNADAQNLP